MYIAHGRHVPKDLGQGQFGQSIDHISFQRGGMYVLLVCYRGRSTVRVVRDCMTPIYKRTFDMDVDYFKFIELLLEKN